MVSRIPETAKLWVAKLVVIIATTTLLVWISRIFTAAVVRRKFCTGNGCKPLLHWYRHRGPLGLVGLDLVFEQVKALREKKVLDLSVDDHKNLGVTYGSRYFTQPLISTIDPENIKTVLTARFKDYAVRSIRAPKLGPLLGRGIFVTDDQEWSHSRAMLRPNFARAQVADLAMMDRHIRHLLSAVQPGVAVNLQELFSRFTLDSSTEFLFGQSTDSQLGGEFATREFSHNLESAFKEVALELRMGDLSAFRSSTEKRRRDESYRVCRSFVAGFVDKAMDLRRESEAGGEKSGNGNPRNYFLKELALTSLDRDGITDALLNLLFAGRDTTSSLLSSLFLVLARRPDVWDKLRDEVAYVLCGQPPTYDHLRGMKYANNCIQESKGFLSTLGNNMNITKSMFSSLQHFDCGLLCPRPCVLQFVIRCCRTEAGLKVVTLSWWPRDI